MFENSIITKIFTALRHPRLVKNNESLAIYALMSQLPRSYKDKNALTVLLFNVFNEQLADCIERLPCQDGTTLELTVNSADYYKAADVYPISFSVKAWGITLLWSLDLRTRMPLQHTAGFSNVRAHSSEVKVIVSDVYKIRDLFNQMLLSHYCVFQKNKIFQTDPAKYLFKEKGIILKASASSIEAAQRVFSFTIPYKDEGSKSGINLSLRVKPIKNPQEQIQFSCVAITYKGSTLVDGWCDGALSNDTITKFQNFLIPKFSY